MPEWFETGIPQSWAWTLLHPYIVECPPENEPLAWEIYPRLTIVNNPDAIRAGQRAGGADISNNVTALSWTGRETLFEWDAPGRIEGPYRQRTITHTKGVPRYAAFVSQYVSKREAKGRQEGSGVLSWRDAECHVCAALGREHETTHGKGKAAGWICAASGTRDCQQ